MRDLLEEMIKVCENLKEAGDIDVLPNKVELLAQLDKAIKDAPDEDPGEKFGHDISNPDSHGNTSEVPFNTGDVSREGGQGQSLSKAKEAGQILHFDMGGADVTAINTKKSLTFLCNRIAKQSVAASLSPTLPKTKKAGAGKRVPYKQSPKGLVTEKGAEFFSDGAVLVKGKPPKDWKKGDRKPETPERIAEIIASFSTDLAPAEIAYNYLEGNDEYSNVDDGLIVSRDEIKIKPLAFGKIITMVKQGDLYFGYDQTAINFIKGYFPEALLFYSAASPQALVFKEGEEIVGILMVLRTFEMGTATPPYMDMLSADGEAVEES